MVNQNRIVANNKHPVIIIYIKLNLFHFFKIITATRIRLKGEAHSIFKFCLVPEWSVPNHIMISMIPRIPVNNKLAEDHKLKVFPF